jgi:MOSC domain-containing protein YiiM
MQVVSVNVGGPRTQSWRGQMVTTAIFKAPVAGRVRVAGVNLEGDAQADLSVHGGAHQAVYAYPMEHYAFWRQELPAAELSWGAFGENLTAEGWLEEDVGVGDRYRVGSAELTVTHPRMPCYKLGLRFGRVDMVERFLTARRNGFYLAVAREGDVGQGDAIELVERHATRLSIAEVVALYRDPAAETARLALAALHPGLCPAWQEHFRKRLQKTQG